jgi:hypothetical protein
MKEVVIELVDVGDGMNYWPEEVEETEEGREEIGKESVDENGLMDYWSSSKTYSFEEFVNYKQTNEEKELEKESKKSKKNGSAEKMQAGVSLSQTKKMMKN